MSKRIRAKMEGLIALHKSFYPEVKERLLKVCACGSKFYGKSERCKPCRAEFL
jgi:hypothetical protein